ncbi:hypothetical protein G6O67_000155 [Ophiocordyceps sinensis]|uniref:Uncharacterized protein n=1 Tax=Ophiocordyceps sinensis TaxID=72228 RepID=A0A8H4PYF6_9HYPO|nr:hypothetical protein G6O67_000155 [Ophiocordyceps sinensis]
MRLYATALLAATCTAKLRSWQENWGWKIASGSRFTIDQGSYVVDGASGCRGTGVPGMVEFCVDWPKKRGHFRFDGQRRRCLVQKSGKYWLSGGHTCQEWVMEEAPCRW